MQPIAVDSFLGASLAFDERLIPPGVGIDSKNQRPGYSDLRPWNLPLTVATVPSSPQRLTIYRLGQDVASDANYWFQWTTIVHAIRGFESGSADTTERTYWTGSGTPKWSDNVIGLSGGAPYPQATRELGVPAPTNPLTATQAAAGTGTDETTSWLYTFVNDIGWESAPSPPSNDLLIKPGATVNLTGFSSAPAGNYGITKIRLYRSQIGTNGSRTYKFHREWNIGSTPANPIDDARALGTDTLQTVGWLPCPGIPVGGASGITETTAKCLTKLWNGMAAVISGKGVRICEPTKMYAWPLKYEIPTTDNPLGIATWGQRMLILTNGDVYVAVGSTPEGMDAEPQNLFWPLESERSVVEFTTDSPMGGVARSGAVWASRNGLCWLGDGGPRNLTKDLLTPEQWQALSPSTMRATRYLGFYFCSYDSGGGVMKAFMIDPSNPVGIYWLDVGYHAMFRDPKTDTVFVLEGDVIKKWNASGSPMTAKFKSRQMRQRAPFNIGAIEVIAAAYPVTVRLYADGALWHQQTVNGDEPIKPPGGKETDEWQLEVESQQRVIAVRLARTLADLRS